MYLGQFEESLEYLKKEDILLNTLDRPHPWFTFRIGYAYWVNGFKEEAEYYFNTGLEFHLEMIELGRHYNQDFHTFYILAAMYAFLGDKDKAYKNLRIVNQRQRIPLWMIKDIKNDPLFNTIRDEPEFQQIVRDIEAKYQAEHERVRKWLEENDML
jgi:tetratricopeptide (TPR) repeat protein